MDASVTVLYDFRDPYSYLALGATFDLIDELEIAASWQVLLITPPRLPVAPAPAADRGSWHRWHRSRYWEMDLIRSATALGIPARHLADGGWYRACSGVVAAQAAAWIEREHPQRLRELLTQIFTGYWDGDLALDDATQISALIAGLDADAQGFSRYLDDIGPAELAEQQRALAEQGYFTVPGYVLCDEVLGEEVFYGRQHLPLIRQRLDAGSNNSK